MIELRNAWLIYLKGALFVLVGLAAAGLLFAQQPTLRTAVLLMIAVWAFARAYYFAFYVIEHYVDAEFRFAGLWAFAKYLIGRRGR